MLNHIDIFLTANIYLNAAFNFLLTVLIVELLIFITRQKKIKAFRLMLFLRFLPGSCRRCRAPTVARR